MSGGDPSSNGHSSSGDNSGNRGSGSQRGRGGRGSAATRGGSTEVERNIGTIHGDLFTRDLMKDKKGTRGTPVDCFANYVRIIGYPENQIYQYHVKFTPAVDSKAMREQILAGVGLELNVIFDGAMLYSPKTFGNAAEATFTGRHPTSGSPITVTLTSTVQFTNNDPQAIHVYDLLIRRSMKMSNLVPVGRHFFDPKGNYAVPNYNIEVWPGYQTAARLHEEGLMLCIENRWKVLRKDTVLDQMQMLLKRCSGANERFWAECERLFPAQTVITLYNNKLYRLTRIEKDMSPQSTFTLADGTETTFVDYYKAQYNIDVTDLHQPLLVSEGKPKQPGEEPQKTYLLPQLCYMTGITDEMRNNMSCMKAMSHVTRLTPQARAEMTMKWLKAIASNPEIQKMFAQWEFELDKEICGFQARVLPPERLFGHTPAGYEGQNAEWARFVKNAGNCASRDMLNWIVIAPAMQNAMDVAGKFIAECQNLGRSLGMNVGAPLCRTVQTGDAVEYNEVAREALESVKGHDVHMMVIILKDDNKTRYDAMKKFLCLDKPVPSQCIKLSTLLGKAPDRGENKNFGSIVLKIMLQMNCKMGGAIWKVKIPFKRGMIVGYDLYSDSTTRGKAAGACVSSFDQEFTQWYSQCRHHENPTELGANLTHFVKKALKVYYDNNQQELPDRLILYRDGVGDGQIPYVMKQEVPQVKEACAEICRVAGKTPIRIAFVLVTKKVNTRVFRAGGMGNVQNPMPGTIVDHMVTRPERYDFYMVPQAVNQGTVTPVYYSVLHDDTGFDPDKHHALAFKLCHLYYNWQGTVRVPAPCQYAHKLAFLFAQTLHRDAHSTLRNKLYYL